MTDTRSDIEEDPVRRRLARLLDENRRDNEELLGELKRAEDAWEGLHKEVDEAIGEEFDLHTTEREAVLAARKHLTKPETLPSDEGFVVGGRIFERERKGGLPHVAVRVIREREGREEVLAETLTDEMGNFRSLVPKRFLETAGAAREKVRFEALTAPGEKPLLVVEKSLRMDAGRVEEVDLSVAATRKVAAAAAAAETVRDSVEESIDSVERRLESMKTAHSAVTRFAELTRDGLEALRRDLSVEVPPIPAAVPIEGIEPLAPEEGPSGPARPSGPIAPATTSTPLRRLRGIGPKREEQLRAAGILDLEAFLRTDTATLAGIMGFDARPAKEEAERVLKEHQAATGGPTAKRARARKRPSRKTPSRRKGGRG